MRIAVLDDDPAQTDLVCQTLSGAGHICHAYSGGRALVQQLRTQTFDLLVLDWNVPDLSGEEILHWVRRSLPGVLPVLFITSRSGEGDVTSILNAGADDYLIKPVSPDMLLARVGALLRRAHASSGSASRQEFGAYGFDLDARQVTVRGAEVALTQREFDLALLLFRHLGRPLSRLHIQEVVWQLATEIPSRTMDTHISMLRTKLALRPENGYRLTPIYGFGYRLERIGGEDR
ncbi:response regulator transcription factor [Paraburkholderia aspalathi]|uniref:response regulator transcription factor n=1 Tax=Paraburkholderia nemoris TaxID=2793076 RepID=UPI00190A46EE|nr:MULTISPECIES: response regulator transcription factor [Paraburkholderia]MBK3786912.1 response regulator transcription factor [Paraburkholderia aspalathi]